MQTLAPFLGIMLPRVNSHLYHFRDTELNGKNGCRARMRARSLGWNDEKLEKESGLVGGRREKRLSGREGTYLPAHQPGEVTETRPPGGWQLTPCSAWFFPRSAPAEHAPR